MKKMEKNGDTIIKNFSSRLFPKARKYKEVKVYKKLIPSEVNVPELKSETNTRIVLEYIKDKEKYNKEDLHLISKELIKFQFSKIKPKEKLITKVYDNFYFRIFLFLIIFFRISFFLKMKIIYFLIKDYFNQPKIGIILLHNDFNKGQVLINDKVFLIDFEAVIRTNKWIYADIINACFDINKLNLDTEWFNIYNNLLKKKPEIHSKIFILEQFRTSLIQYFIKLMGARKLTNKEKEFLKNVVLNTKNLSTWIKNNVLK